MADPRKDCPKCGLENAPFGRNKNNKDGLSSWCKMCMRDSRAAAAEKNPPDWKEINRRRRARPGYREKERAAANARDKERRKKDPDYVWTRSESNRRWRKSGDAEAKRKRANELRNERHRRRRLQMSPEVIERLKENQRRGWQQWLRMNDVIFENRRPQQK